MVAKGGPKSWAIERILSPTHEGWKEAPWNFPADSLLVVNGPQRAAHFARRLCLVCLQGTSQGQLSSGSLLTAGSQVLG